MGKIVSKNLQKVQDMLDGKRTGKLVVGQYNPEEETRNQPVRRQDLKGFEPCTSCTLTSDHNQ